jgi:hypothetical protein
VTVEVDDFHFEPTTWDLAVAIGLEPEEPDRPALEELGDALLVNASEDVLAGLTTAAVDRLWSGELEHAIRDGLSALVARGDEWASAAADALASLDRDGPRAAVTAEVVRQLAWHLSTGDLPPFHCFDCLEEAVAAAPPGDRRGIAIQAALIGLHDADLRREEVLEALAHRDPTALATDERRRAVRRRLARLARFADGPLPAVAAELHKIAREPLPASASDDDAWRTVAAAALAAVAQPHLN